MTAVMARRSECVTWSTFNIRYDNPEDEGNRWRFRRDSVVRFVKDHDIDVIGMQEVLWLQLQDLRARLPEYDYVGVCRDDGDRKGEAAPIFFRRQRFRALESGTFWLSQYPDSIGFIGWDGACCRIATWARLQDKQTGRVLVAVNTHFDHVGREARRQSALLIIDRIKQMAGEETAILTGDFNVDDQSEAYRTITENPYVLRDAHKVATSTSGPAYTWHDFGRMPEGERGKIDFIFVTPDVRVRSSNILPIHECDVRIPATRWGYLSDHSPVWAELDF